MATTREDKTREANFLDIGVAGRKTGITIPTQERNEFGLEDPNNIWSPSPVPVKTSEPLSAFLTGTQGQGGAIGGKAADQTLSAEESMDIDESSDNQAPAAIAISSARGRAQSFTSTAAPPPSFIPRATSPFKPLSSSSAILNTPPRRATSVGPSGFTPLNRPGSRGPSMSPVRGLGGPTLATNRLLNFAQHDLAASPILQPPRRPSAPPVSPGPQQRNTRLDSSPIRGPVSRGSIFGGGNAKTTALVNGKSKETGAKAQSQPQLISSSSGQSLLVKTTKTNSTVSTKVTTDSNKEKKLQNKLSKQQQVLSQPSASQLTTTKTDAESTTPPGVPPPSAYAVLNAKLPASAQPQPPPPLPPLPPSVVHQPTKPAVPKKLLSSRLAAAPAQPASFSLGDEDEDDDAIAYVPVADEPQQKKSKIVAPPTKGKSRNVKDQEDGEVEEKVVIPEQPVEEEEEALEEEAAFPLPAKSKVVPAATGKKAVTTQGNKSGGIQSKKKSAALAKSTAAEKAQLKRKGRAKEVVQEEEDPEEAEEAEEIEEEEPLTPKPTKKATANAKRIVKGTPTPVKKGGKKQPIPEPEPEPEPEEEEEDEEVKTPQLTPKSRFKGGGAAAAVVPKATSSKHAPPKASAAHGRAKVAGKAAATKGAKQGKKQQQQEEVGEEIGEQEPGPAPVTKPGRKTNANGKAKAAPPPPSPPPVEEPAPAKKGRGRKKKQDEQDVDIDMEVPAEEPPRPPTPVKKGRGGKGKQQPYAEEVEPVASQRAVAGSSGAAASKAKPTAAGRGKASAAAGGKRGKVSRQKQEDPDEDMPDAEQNIDLFVQEQLRQEAQADDHDEEPGPPAKKARKSAPTKQPPKSKSNATKSKPSSQPPAATAAQSARSESPDILTRARGPTQQIRIEKPVIPVPAPEDADKRRSARARIAPLQFWTGEKVILKPNEIEVIRVDQHEPVTRKCRAGSASAAARKRKRGESTEPSSQGGAKGRVSKLKKVKEEEEGEEEEAEDWEEEGALVGWVKSRDKPEDEVETDLAYSSTRLTTNEVAHSTFRMCKSFAMPHFGTGLIDIPPGGQKRWKSAGKYDLVFYVVKGKVRVAIGENVFRVRRGGQFMVTRGNLYNIENEFEGPVRLFFAQGCQEGMAS